MKTYVAECRRVDGWWAVDVPDVRGAHTQARRLDRAEAMTREVLSILLDESPESVEVELKVILSEGMQATIDQARDHREVADRERRRASAASRNAARSLADAGLSVRDIGALLGVTYQRAAQLLREEAA